MNNTSQEAKGTSDDNAHASLPQKKRGSSQEDSLDDEHMSLNEDVGCKPSPSSTFVAMKQPPYQNDGDSKPSSKSKTNKVSNNSSQKPSKKRKRSDRSDNSSDDNFQDKKEENLKPPPGRKKKSPPQSKSNNKLSSNKHSRKSSSNSRKPSRKSHGKSKSNSKVPPKHQVLLESLSPQDKDRFLEADARRKNDDLALLDAHSHLLEMRREMQRIQAELGEVQIEYDEKMAETKQPSDEGDNLSTSNETWLNNYQRLKQFMREHVNLEMLAQYDSYLGSWVKTQVTLYRNSKEGKLPSLSADRMGMLQELGIIAFDSEQENAVSWEERFQELLDYKSRFGHVNVPWQWNENEGLAQWVNTQRKRYKGVKENGNEQNDLSEEQIAKLNSVGFDWIVHSITASTVQSSQIDCAMPNNVPMDQWQPLSVFAAPVDAFQSLDPSIAASTAAAAIFDPNAMIASLANDPQQSIAQQANLQPLQQLAPAINNIPRNAQVNYLNTIAGASLDTGINANNTQQNILQGGTIPADQQLQALLNNALMQQQVLLQNNVIPAPSIHPSPQVLQQILANHQQQLILQQQLGQQSSPAEQALLQQLILNVQPQQQLLLSTVVPQTSSTSNNLLLNSLPLAQLASQTNSSQQQLLLPTVVPQTSSTSTNVLLNSLPLTQLASQTSSSQQQQQQLFAFPGMHSQALDFPSALVPPASHNNGQQPYLELLNQQMPDALLSGDSTSLPPQPYQNN